MFKYLQIHLPGPPGINSTSPPIVNKNQLINIKANNVQYPQTKHNLISNNFKLAPVEKNNSNPYSITDTPMITVYQHD